MSGSDASTAFAAIANGTLTIANPALQQALTGQTPAQVLASLNHDTANTNRALAALPNLQLKLQNQADLAAAQAAATQSAQQVLGAPLAKAIGDAAKNGDISTAAQYIAQAALGCGLGALSGNCGSGALGAVTGEAVGQFLVQQWTQDKLTALRNGEPLDPAQLVADVHSLQEQGADIASLFSGLVVAASGGNASVGALTGDNAARNNAVQVLIPLAVVIVEAATVTAETAATCAANPVCRAIAINIGKQIIIEMSAGDGSTPGIGHNGGPPLDKADNTTGGDQPDPNQTPPDPNKPPVDPATATAAEIAAAAAKAIINETIQVDSKGNALVGDWSSTGSLTAPENALGHWDKHAAEFSEYSNATQYVEGAQSFIHNPPAGTLTKIRQNGDVLFYDPASNTFAVSNSAGAPKTMFRPTAGSSYWSKQ